MTLDADFAAYNARVTAAVPRAADPSPDARRARMEAVVRRFPYPPDAVERTLHWLALPGRELVLRVYRPRTGRLPAVLYLHGGGWAAGSIDTHDGAAAALAADASVVVASLHYRRAPENPFPAPNDDTFAALRWLVAHADALQIDGTRLGVAGDSAGAHLALGAAIEARDTALVRLAFMLLVYPVVEPDFDTPSYREHAHSATLTRDDMRWYWSCYLPDASRGDARALPGRANLAGLPPACVLAARYDPLYDEDVRLAARLREAGVPVTLIEAATLGHGFLRAAPYVPEARRMQAALGAAMRVGMHGGPGGVVP